MSPNADSDLLTLGRGLLIGAAAGAVAAVVPWALLHLILLTKHLGAALDPSPDGARVASYFLAAVVGTGVCVMFATRPRTTSLQSVFPVAAVGLVALLLAGDGRSHKSEPPFGEDPADLLRLTVPAVGTGVLLVAWRTLLAPRTPPTVPGRGTQDRS